MGLVSEAEMRKSCGETIIIAKTWEPSSQRGFVDVSPDDSSGLSHFFLVWITMVT